jgi:hypothetical protein
LRTYLTCLLLSLALVACGGGGGSDNDAGPSDDGDDGDEGDDDGCDWPIESATEAGTIELGTGTSSWLPMPAELSFVLGTQSGTFLILHSRIKDLDPGNVDNFLDPRNPKTRFSATLVDGTLVGRECPSSQGYKPTDDGWFERKQFQNLEFLPFSLGEAAFDTTLKLKVEIIDADGKYASDEKDVFCRAPNGWTADAGVEIDAGAADAGPESDASL